MFASSHSGRWRWASGFPNGTSLGMAQFTEHAHLANPKSGRQVKPYENEGQVMYCSSFIGGYSLVISHSYETCPVLGDL